MAEILFNPHELVKTKDYLVCIDSDGCVFDTMEVKHKECFIPNIIRWWNLEAVSKYARMASEFVNLYSKDRGCNRFPALVKTFDLLDDWADVGRRGYHSPDISSLRHWCETETKLGNPALKAFVEAHPEDEIMRNTLAWSVAVNETIEEVVRFVPPFPLVIETLQKLAEHADIIIVSGTPSDALAREWELHAIAPYVRVIAGQEAGSKKDCIRAAMEKGYATDRVIMIGDAPGDQKAAVANGVKFYPINPGSEEASWERFYNTVADLFLQGTYSGDVEAEVLAEFDRTLPAVPHWK